MKKTEKLAASFIQKIVVREQAEWPPVCSGLFYQPERPFVDSRHSTEDTLKLKNKQK